ncbi:hypothetical protein N431DRAFT_386636 [Stipitochalara longipes BDJ]|nr:hypothetical protein N431DRAFT_386636 [Stipitochalara longipes BDJ]
MKSNARNRSLGAIWQRLLTTSLLLLTSTCPTLAATKGRGPITLSSTGGFEIGGSVIMNGTNPNQTLSCDHGYVEYFLPYTPRKTSLLMWHSSSTQVFQNTWSGGRGYKDLWLSRDYPVYLWDGPRVGRANWGCVPQTYMPGYRDAGNFVAWNFGPRFLEWWDGSQFAGILGTTENGTTLVDQEARDKAWKEAVRKRYDEMDTDENVLLHGQTAAVAADSGKIGNQIVYITNSAAGLRAQVAVVLSNSSNIKGIVAYESVGYVFPASFNLTAAGVVKLPGFGPFVVPDEQFARLKDVKVQFIWGDHRAENDTNLIGPYVMQSRLVAGLINGIGGQAEVLHLAGEGTGLKGNTHIAFADENNESVAGLMEEWLKRVGLDEYAEDSK